MFMKMKVEIAVSFFIMAVICQLYCVDGCGSRARRTPSSGRRSSPVPKPRCDLTNYHGSEFTGKTPRVHTGFLRYIRIINGYARQCNVKVYVTSSYRTTTRVRGAIVTPATRSNHLVGHAIDMNLIDRATGRFCNSGCLGGSNKPSGVTCFINKIKSNGSLRWGGDCRKSDPVHIDDGINVNNRGLWNQLYNSLQKNCP